MNLKRFEQEHSNLVSLITDKGFYRDPDEFEKDVFVSLLNYEFDLKTIVSRLEDDVPAFDSAIQSISKEMLETSKPKPKGEGLITAFARLRLDLSDFYLHTRIFLDTLTVCIKRSFRSAGNRKWSIIEHSVSCLLNKSKLQKYKNEIDLVFFEGLSKQLLWVRDFKESRDDLLHQFYYFVFTQTRKGDLGYDIVARQASWGSETVKGILADIQVRIDCLSDLMQYLSRNLPTALR